MRGRWRFRSLYRFFGLTQNSDPAHFKVVRDSVLNEIFHCVYQGKLSFTEAFNIPVSYRRWWINKVVEVNNAANDQNQ